MFSRGDGGISLLQLLEEQRLGFVLTVVSVRTRLSAGYLRLLPPPGGRLCVQTDVLLVQGDQGGEGGGGADMDDDDEEDILISLTSDNPNTKGNLVK